MNLRYPFTTYGDFDDPERAEKIGQHKSVETAKRMLERTFYHGRSVYGWVWISGLVPYTTEVILKPHREWEEARIRAFADWSYPHHPACTVASCCGTSGFVVDHRKTTRHFRYWCLENRSQALLHWPWLREVMASEVLGGLNEREASA